MQDTGLLSLRTTETAENFNALNEDHGSMKNVLKQQITKPDLSKQGNIRAKSQEGHKEQNTKVTTQRGEGIKTWSGHFFLISVV